jgi:hypothetical protein
MQKLPCTYCQSQAAVLSMQRSRLNFDCGCGFASVLQPPSHDIPWPPTPLCYFTSTALNYWFPLQSTVFKYSAYNTLLVTHCIFRVPCQMPPAFTHGSSGQPNASCSHSWKLWTAKCLLLSLMEALHSVNWTIPTASTCLMQGTSGVVLKDSTLNGKTVLSATLCEVPWFDASQLLHAACCCCGRPRGEGCVLLAMCFGMLRAIGYVLHVMCCGMPRAIGYVLYVMCCGMPRGEGCVLLAMCCDMPQGTGCVLHCTSEYLQQIVLACE